MSWNGFHTEAGYIYPVVVWPDATEGTDEYGERRPWRHCRVPPRRVMRAVQRLNPISGQVENGEEEDPAFTLRAAIIPLTPAQAIRFRDRLVLTGKCKVYRTRAAAAADHPEIDWDRVGRIYGIDV